MARNLELIKHLFPTRYVHVTQLTQYNCDYILYLQNRKYGIKLLDYSLGESDFVDSARLLEFTARARCLH